MKGNPNPQAESRIWSSGSCPSFNRVIEIKNSMLSVGRQALVLLSLLLQCVQGHIFLPPTLAPPFLRPISTPSTITITTPFPPSYSYGIKLIIIGVYWILTSHSSVTYPQHFPGCLLPYSHSSFTAHFFFFFNFFVFSLGKQRTKANAGY